MMKESCFDKVVDHAKDSEGKFRHAALCLDSKGRVLSAATNSYKTHPIQAEYARRSGKAKKVSLHAEIASLVKAKGDVDTLIVARVNRAGELRNSKPCRICQLALSEAEVETVWYSTEEGFDRL